MHLTSRVEWTAVRCGGNLALTVAATSFLKRRGTHESILFLIACVLDCRSERPRRRFGARCVLEQAQGPGRGSQSRLRVGSASRRPRTGDRLR